MIGLPNTQKPYTENCYPHNIIYNLKTLEQLDTNIMDTLPTHLLKILQEITDHTLSSWCVYGEENIGVTLKFSGHII